METPKDVLLRRFTRSAKCLNLVEVQKNSYNEFLKNGIGEVFKDFSPIRDFSNKMELWFLEHHFEMTPKYTEKECKDRDATYAVPLKVKVRLVNKETGLITEQEVFMGDMPLMTPNGSFIINGCGARGRKPACQKSRRVF